MRDDPELTLERASRRYDLALGELAMRDDPELTLERASRRYDLALGELQTEARNA